MSGDSDMGGLEAARAEVLERVAASADDLVTLTLSLSQLEDRAGRERPVAEAIHAWWTSRGVDAQLHVLDESSANVVAALPTMGSGLPALTLNAHLDTEGDVPAGNPDRRSRLRGAWREGDLLVGKGLVNDKVQVAAQMIAVQALLEARVPLPRGLIVAGVAQETGSPVLLAPPGRGPDPLHPPHVGEGGGTRALLDTGMASECALVGEPTGFAVCGAQAGVLRIRFDVSGQLLYTPFVRRSGDPNTSSNPHEGTARLVQTLVDWARRFEQDNALSFWGGTVVPTAQVHGIRSWGQPFTEERDYCHVFFDVRPPPGQDLDTLYDGIRQVVTDLGIEAEATVYDRHAGHVADEKAAIVGAVNTAHQLVHGTEPPSPQAPQVRMWQDTNVYLAAGVPAVSYGIRTVAEPYTIEKRRAASIADAVALAQVYALVALELCGEQV